MEPDKAPNQKVFFKNEGFDKERNNEPFGPVYIIDFDRLPKGQEWFNLDSDGIEDLGWLPKSVGRQIAKDRGIPFEADDEEMLKNPEAVAALARFDEFFKDKPEE